MQKLPNETVASLLSLTWDAVRLIFSKPKILVLLLAITFPLCLLFPFTISYYKEWNHRNYWVIFWLVYFSFLLVALIPYTFSLRLLKTEVSSSKYIQNLAHLFYNYKIIVFLKTLYFICIKNILVFVFLACYTKLENLSQAYQAIAFIFFPPSWFFMIYIILLAILLTALYTGIKFIIALPYGIIGGQGLYSACNESAQSMYGSKLSTLYWFIILGFIIYVTDLILMDLFWGFYMFVISYESRNYELAFDLLNVFRGMFMIFFSLIYSTTINLLYFKRTKVDQ